MSRILQGSGPDSPATHAAGSAVTVEVDRLKAQSGSDLRYQKHLGILAAAALGAFLFLIYIPSVATLSDLRERISHDLRQLQSDRERSRDLPQLASRADLLENQLSAFKPLQSTSGVQEFVERAFDLSMQLQLRNLDCQPGETAVKGQLASTPVKLTLSGNFSNVFTFVRECEHVSHYVRIQDMKIRQRPKEPDQPFAIPGEVNLEMTIVFFHQSAPPRTAPPA